MEFSGKLSNALHLQQQTLCGGEWRSLPWAAKNGKSARADDLKVSLEYLYRPQLNSKFCSSALQDPLWALLSSGCEERGAWPGLHTLLPFHPASTTSGTERNAKLLFYMKLLLPRGKAGL